MLNREFSIDVCYFLKNLNEHGWVTADVVAMADMLIGEEITIFMTSFPASVSSAKRGREGITYACRMGYEIPDIAIKK